MSEKATRIDTIIGIDPGKAGGIAIYMPGVGTKVMRMPTQVGDLVEMLKYYSENFTPLVFLEKLSVHLDDASVSGGRVNMGKVIRLQKLMANYEQLRTVLEILGIPYVMVHPMTWQTKLNLRRTGEKEDKVKRKRRYVDFVKGLYPDIRATLWNTDALLIMHFGRYAIANERAWIKSNLPESEYDKIY